MSFVDTLRQWDEAVTCADRQDWPEALSIFLSIQEPNSKICFDIGCLHLRNQDLDAAEKAFDCSIRKDEHLAVAFFQRGITFYKQKRYEESSADFQRAFKALRNNQLIDYKALGLRYILYACEMTLFSPCCCFRRALEGEAHTVLFEFVPETSDELAVVPGNIVFVLQKGTDNWAYVVFNERKGLVPYNYLEPTLDISLGSKKIKVFFFFLDTFQLTSSNVIGPNLHFCPEDNSCFVKIRFTFNFAVLVPSGSSYVVLIEKISKKLNLNSTAITLSSDSRGKNLIDNNTEMEDVWSRAEDGRIILWCTTREQSDGKPQKEVYLVALHSYNSSNPEDLSLQEGDKIKLLSKVNQDWLEGQCNGNTGIFPASFAAEVPVDGQ
uniref:Neutrophil cytosolic factor 2 n=1 Tax=Xiphophorus couchianus TaxID=32473 RepID=A0A3B5L675_9TELE